MKAKTTFSIWAAGLLILSLLLSATAGAQTTTLPIRIRLVADQISYGPSEPIQIQVVVSNDLDDAIGDVISRKGWFYQDFHLMITFIDPDGIPITHKFARPKPEPGPPYIYAGRDAAIVEIIPYHGKNIFVMDDARGNYDLGKYGMYTAKVNASLETFSEYVADEETGELFSYLDDPEREDFDPVATNQIRFEIVPPEPAARSSIDTYVDLLKIESGANKPGATKSSLEHAEVHLYKQSEIRDDYKPVNWKVYSEIWNNEAPLQVVFTNSEGHASFYNIEQDDYVVIARHSEFSDVKHMGSPLGADDPCWQTAEACEKHLKVLLKADGKKVAGQTKKLKGSLLLITEPEYVEWDSTQELYPFVFESIGDWDITTSVAPPEGFETDFKSIDAQVINEMEAVQFTVTDVGSSWKETKVKYKIKHKKKTQTLESKIGIKVSKKLAKEKGLGIYGETEDPGPFKGGKKVKYSKKDK